LLLVSPSSNAQYHRGIGVIIELVPLSSIQAQ
jgi:hypothetical protein